MSFSSKMRFVVDLLMPTAGSNAPSARRRSSFTLRSSFWAFSVVLTAICGSLTADDKPTVALLGGDAVAGWRSNGHEFWKKEFPVSSLNTVNLAMPGEMPKQTLQKLSDGILDSVKPRIIIYMPTASDPASGKGVLDDVLAIRSVLRMFARLHPEAAVIYCPVAPRGNTVDSPVRIHLDLVNQSVGCYIYRMTQGVPRPKIVTCNFNSLLLDRDGRLSKTMLETYGRLSPRAYGIWSVALKPYVDYALSPNAPLPRSTAPRTPVAFETKVTPQFAQISKGWLASGFSAANAKKGTFVPDERLAEKRREFLANRSRHYNLIMVGDSITHLFETGRGRDEWKKLTAGRRVLNLGFGGNTVRNALWNLKYGGFLDGVTVDAVSVMIGTNNRGESPEFVFDAIKEIVRVIQKKQPKAKVLLHPMLPRVSPKHSALRAKNDKTNAMLKKLADGKRVVLVDLNPLYENASPEKLKDLLPDGTHPGAEGYRMWREKLEKLLPPASETSGPAEDLCSLRLRMAPNGDSGVFLPTETPSFSFSISNSTVRAKMFEAEFRVEDYFGATVSKETLRREIFAGGCLEQRMECAKARLPGFYCVSVKWKCGGASGMEECSFVKVAELPSRPDRMFGISSFAKDEARLYAKLGVGTKAIYLDWRAHEDGHGNLSLEKTAAYVKSLREKGITVVGHFPAVSDSATPRRYLKRKAGKKDDPISDPKAMYAGMQSFVEAVVNRFRGDIHEWSAVAEINLLAGRAPYCRQRYIDVVKLISKSIRKTDPSAEILALGCSGADGREKPRFRFLQGMLPELTDNIDGFGIDQYTAGQKYGVGFTSLDTEQSELREIMTVALDIAKKNGGKIVAIDEKGPAIVRSTRLSSPEGRRMANMVARDFIILKTLPEVRHWLYFRPRNWNPKSVVDWGMWECENPRQTVSAYASTARLMAHAAFAGEKPLHKSIVCWKFKNSEGPFATIWYNGSTPLKFKLPDDAKVSVRDVQGNPVNLSGKELMLSDAPLYLYSSSMRELDRVLDGARYQAADLEGAVDVVDSGHMALLLRNVSGKPLTATVVAADFDPPVDAALLPRNPISIAADCVGRVEIAALPKKSSFTVETSNSATTKIEGKFSLYSLRKIGGWNDIGMANEIVLEDPALQMPGYGDLKSNGLYEGVDDLSVRARFGYDDDSFYMEVRVKDDIHFNDKAPARCFVGDCVQYGFDTLRNATFDALSGRNGWGEDDYRFTSALADGKPVTYCYGAAACNRNRMDRREFTAPSVTRDERTKVTTYRVKIPFADLAPLKPEKGRVFGFSFLAFDKDGERIAAYRIESTQGLAGNTNPAEFLAFVFETE